MKIVYMSLNGPYTEGWTYQENVLSKYHRRLGHQVTIIAPNQRHIDSGEIVATPCEDYCNQDDVRIIRLQKVKSIIKKMSVIFPNYLVYPLLEEIRPDFIMIHGMIGTISALQVRKYIREINPECVAVADIHQDSLNSIPPHNILKRVILQTIHRYLNYKMYAYYKKVFYVAPSCKQFAKEYYKVPGEKLELLPLGCDPEYIDIVNKSNIRARIREKFNIDEANIVLCHGGKMDPKKKTINLVEAVKKLHATNKKVALILFGSFTDEYGTVVLSEIEKNNDFMKYAGMLTAEEYYKIYLASDIAVFPGGQSVLWQQAIACGVATVVSRKPGIEYLDFGGNLEVLEDVSADEISACLQRLIQTERYKTMQTVAEEKCVDFLSYEKIARQVLACASGDMASENSR